MASKKKASDLLPEYKMDYKQRGTALIFNQERFFWKLNLKQRSGTAKDKEDLTERGDQCKSLVGKPKIFIFQACRGDITDNAVAGMALNEMYSEVEEDAASIYTLPAGADFLMCYCVAEGE
ncbi:hypothetical protein SRHO_G00037870 [Serrasalmus rhombeus]